MIIITNDAKRGYARAKAFALIPAEVKIVKRINDIRGYKDLPLLYAGEPYMLDDFNEIIDYAVQHNIKAVKFNYGNDMENPDVVMA